MPAAVTIQALAKTYRTGWFWRDSVRALDGVSLDVPQGSVFGLLGPNGAGKTTMVKIMLGVAHATSGEARLFGRPPGDPGARRRIGYLPEKHEFPDFLTAEQMLGIYGQMSGVDAAERAHRIPELLERVGLTEAAQQKLGEYSKGMLQRAGLAQALLNEPDLLILDEPTDGVDPVGRKEIRDMLVELKNEGKTVFINSHLLSEVEKVCSEIAILNQGRLVRSGSIQELTAIDRVYDLACTSVPPEVVETFGSRLIRTDAPPQASASGDATSQDASGPGRTASGNGVAVAQDLSRYRAQPEDRADLNAMIDRLRAAGVEIDAIHPVRQTLEDYFVDVVGPQENTPS